MWRTPTSKKLNEEIVQLTFDQHQLYTTQLSGDVVELESIFSEADSILLNAVRQFSMYILTAFSGGCFKVFFSTKNDQFNERILSVLGYDREVVERKGCMTRSVFGESIFLLLPKLY